MASERYTVEQFPADTWNVVDVSGVFICSCGIGRGGEGYANWIAKSLNDVAELAAALKPFAEFGRKWDAQPLRGVGEEFYSIHTGTEHAASLRISDCRRAATVLSKLEGSGT